MRYRKLLFLTGLITFGFCTVSQADNLHYHRQVESGKPKQIECDVVAYGGTPFGASCIAGFLDHGDDLLQ